jgi:hypothetical protein
MVLFWWWEYRFAELQPEWTVRLIKDNYFAGIRPEEVEAIEVFRFPTEVPSRFRWIRVQYGVIAIWSR